MTCYKLYATCSAQEFIEFWQQFYQSKIDEAK